MRLIDSLVIFFCIVAAVYLILNNAHPKVSQKRKKASLVKFQLIRKLENAFASLVATAGVSRKTILVYAALGAFAGSIFGRMVFATIEFIIICSILGAMSPALYYNIRAGNRRQEYVGQLESSMSLITNAYISNPDFVRAVQDSLEYLDYKKPFQQFVTEVTLIDNNVERALRRLEKRIDNAYFSQWIDLVVLAQSDRNMSGLLPSVIHAMNDMKGSNLRMQTAMYAEWRKYFMLVSIAICIPVGLHVFAPDMYATLSTTLPGKGLLLLFLASIVWSIRKALKINCPLGMVGVAKA